MEIGIHIGQDGFSYKELEEVALEADKASLNSFWVLDHLHASPRPDREQMLECWTILSALASKTRDIRLGALVLNINNRPPALLAKMAATLDVVSKGRLNLGIGAGGTNRAERQKNLGYPYEFDAYGIDFPLKPGTRIEKLDEGLRVMKKMWTEETAIFTGEHYSIKNAVCLPKPVQKPYPPIWIGSRGGPKMMRVIARHADGWNIAGTITAEKFIEKRKNLARYLADAMRKTCEVKTSVNIHASVGEDLEKLEELKSTGLDLAILRVPRGKEIDLIQNI